jgi:hypothetical protein
MTLNCKCGRCGWRGTDDEARRIDASLVCPRCWRHGRFLPLLTKPIKVTLLKS